MTSKPPERPVVMRPVKELTGYAKNARLHPEAQLRQIELSLKTYGWTNPLLIDEHDGVIAGHGRLSVAKRLGMKEVPCIVIAELNEAGKRALVLLDNQVALNGRWDEEVLAEELGLLAEDGIPLNELVGFDDFELKKLLGEDFGSGTGGELDETEAEEEKAPAMTVPLLLELSRPLYQRWKAWRAGRSDIEALEAALVELERE